jgi:hypothetical protein
MLKEEAARQSINRENIRGIKHYPKMSILNKDYMEK